MGKESGVGGGGGVEASMVNGWGPSCAEATEGNPAGAGLGGVMGAVVELAEVEF